MNAEELLRTAVCYHLNEVFQGDATQARVRWLDGGFETSDDGRGMGIEREIEGRDYVDLVFGQLDLLDTPLAPSWLQLQGLGLSLLARHCFRLELEVHRRGERRLGSWDFDRARWEWSETGPTEDHGTALRIWPADPFDRSALEAMLDRWIEAQSDHLAKG